MLTKWGYEVVTASSGEEALRVLAERPIAVLVTDQRMRDMTGIALCEEVRERYPAVIRILVTAYSDQATAIDAINRGGVSRYVAKPWRLDEVRQILRNAVKGEEQPKPKLGSRIAARFAKIGLDDDLPELHGQDVRPAQYDS